MRAVNLPCKVALRHRLHSRETIMKASSDGRWTDKRNQSAFQFASRSIENLNLLYCDLEMSFACGTHSVCPLYISFVYWHTKLSYRRIESSQRSGSGRCVPLCSMYEEWKNGCDDDEEESRKLGRVHLRVCDWRTKTRIRCLVTSRRP